MTDCSCQLQCGLVSLVLLPLARSQLRSSVLSFLGLRLRRASRVRTLNNSRAGYTVIQLYSYAATVYSYTVIQSHSYEVYWCIIHYSLFFYQSKYKVLFPPVMGPSNGLKRPQAFHCCFRAMTKVLECKASWLTTEHGEWKASTRTWPRKSCYVVSIASTLLIFSPDHSDPHTKLQGRELPTFLLEEQ